MQDTLIARWSKLTRTVWTGAPGRRVAWRTVGQGEPLVLLHGGHGSWLHWLRNLDALSYAHQLWLPDLPGFGDSDEVGDSPRDPDRLPELLDRLSGGLDELLGSGRPIDLIGFSFGGLMSAQLAQLRGGVRRLALLGAAGHGGQRRQQRAFENWRGKSDAALRSALRHNLLATMLHAPAAVSPQALEIHQLSCLRTRFHSRSISQQSSLQALLQQRSGPTLLVWGEHDVTCHPHEVIARLLPGAPAREAAVVPGAGHWVQFERAAAVDSLLVDWLARTKP